MPGSELEGAQRTEQMWHMCLWNMRRKETNQRKHKDELDRVKETGLPPAGENETGEPSLNPGVQETGKCISGRMTFLWHPWRETDAARKKETEECVWAPCGRQSSHKGPGAGKHMGSFQRAEESAKDQGLRWSDPGYQACKPQRTFTKKGL